MASSLSVCAPLQGRGLFDARPTIQPAGFTQKRSAAPIDSMTAASRPSETLGTASRIGEGITTRLNCSTPPE